MTPNQTPCSLGSVQHSERFVERLLRLLYWTRERKQTFNKTFAVLNGPQGTGCLVRGHPVKCRKGLLSKRHSALHRQVAVAVCELHEFRETVKHVNTKFSAKTSCPPHLQTTFFFVFQIFDFFVFGNMGPVYRRKKFQTTPSRGQWGFFGRRNVVVNGEL